MRNLDGQTILIMPPAESPAKNGNPSEAEMFRALLYYRYVRIDDPESYLHDHRALCERLELHGRILIGHEGINGTVSGTVPATRAYMEAMHVQDRSLRGTSLSETLDQGPG